MASHGGFSNQQLRCSAASVSSNFRRSNVRAANSFVTRQPDNFSYLQQHCWLRFHAVAAAQRFGNIQTNLPASAAAFCSLASQLRALPSSTAATHTTAWPSAASVALLALALLYAGIQLRRCLRQLRCAGAVPLTNAVALRNWPLLYSSACCRRQQRRPLSLTQRLPPRLMRRWRRQRLLAGNGGMR